MIFISVVLIPINLITRFSCKHFPLSAYRWYNRNFELIFWSMNLDIVVNVSIKIWWYFKRGIRFYLMWNSTFRRICRLDRGRWWFLIKFLTCVYFFNSYWRVPWSLSRRTGLVPGCSDSFGRTGTELLWWPGPTDNLDARSMGTKAWHKATPWLHVFQLGRGCCHLPLSDGGDTNRCRHRGTWTGDHWPSSVLLFLQWPRSIDPTGESKEDVWHPHRPIRSGRPMD